MFKKITPTLQPVKKAKVTFEDEIKSLLNKDEEGVKRVEEEMEVEKSEISLTFNNAKVGDKAILEQEQQSTTEKYINLEMRKVSNGEHSAIRPKQGPKYGGKKTFVWPRSPNLADFDELTESSSLDSDLGTKWADSKTGTLDLTLYAHDISIEILDFLTYVSPWFWAHEADMNTVLNQYAIEVPATIKSDFKTEIGTSANPASVVRRKLTDITGKVYALLQASEAIEEAEKLYPANKEFERFNFPKYEQEYQEEIVKIASDYEQQVMRLNELIKTTLPATATDVKNPDDIKEYSNALPEVVGTVAVQKIVSTTTAKLYSELKEMAKVKKERAELRVEVEKLRRMVSKGGTQGENKDANKEVKKVYESMLVPAAREVLSQFYSYKFALSLAGKIHIRSEQSMFVIDIMDLIRTYCQEKLVLYDSITMLNLDVVKRDVETVLAANLRYFASDSTDPEKVLKDILVPAYLTAVQNSHQDVLKFLTPSSQKPTISSLIKTDPRKPTTLKLFNSFVNYVAARYTADLQVQKNMATTASDKIIQSVAKIEAIKELKQALKEAGYQII